MQVYVLMMTLGFINPIMGGFTILLKMLGMTGCVIIVSNYGLGTHAIHIGFNIKIRESVSLLAIVVFNNFCSNKSTCYDGL